MYQRGLSTDPAPRVELKIRVVPHGLPTPSRNSIGDEMEAKEERYANDEKERTKSDTRFYPRAEQLGVSRNLSANDIGRFVSSRS